jgi:Cytochrome P450
MPNCWRSVHFANKLTSRRTVTNVVPSSITLALHIFRDPSILVEIWQRLADTIKAEDCLKFDWKKLEEQPLLLLIYAETLRFGIQIHVTRSASHRELRVSNTLIPRNKLILINTWLAHTDSAVWNTKKDAFPLDTFWPQRFLIDPNDSSSGPTKKKISSYEKTEAEVKSAKEIHFSTDGLEGS